MINTSSVTYIDNADIELLMPYQNQDADFSVRWLDIPQNHLYCLIAQFQNCNAKFTIFYYGSWNKYWWKRVNKKYYFKSNILRQGIFTEITLF